MKVLHLTLKKKWFDMIASGEKKEEYREMKEYWFKRLCKEHFEKHQIFLGYSGYKQFDIIQFKNGYSKDAPTITLECKGIKMKEGKSEWGAEPGVKYFVIELGELIN